MRMIKCSFYLITSFRFSVTERHILKGFASKTKPACFMILVFDFFASFSEPSDTFCCTFSKVYCFVVWIVFTLNYISPSFTPASFLSSHRSHSLPVEPVTFFILTFIAYPSISSLSLSSTCKASSISLSSLERSSLTSSPEW